jgi:hypothetical protein
MDHRNNPPMPLRRAPFSLLAGLLLFSVVACGGSPDPDGLAPRVADAAPDVSTSVADASPADAADAADSSAVSPDASANPDRARSRTGSLSRT